MRLVILVCYLSKTFSVTTFTNTNKMTKCLYKVTKKSYILVWIFSNLEVRTFMTRNISLHKIIGSEQKRFLFLLHLYRRKQKKETWDLRGSLKSTRNKKRKNSSRLRPLLLLSVWWSHSALVSFCLRD